MAKQTKGKWYLDYLGKKGYRVYQAGTDEYTKIVPTREEGIAHMELIKEQSKQPKLTEVQKRMKRLGISQAEYDSTMASPKFPQFETAAQSTKKKRKQADKDKKDAAVSYKKAQEGRTPDKLVTYVNKWHKLQEKWKDKSETARARELSKRQLDVLIRKVDKAGLKKEFHEQILQESMSGVDVRLPDQIYVDPETKKRYKYVGPDENDPNSYEEL